MVRLELPGELVCPKRPTKSPPLTKSDDYLVICEQKRGFLLNCSDNKVGRGQLKIIKKGVELRSHLQPSVSSLRGALSNQPPLVN